MSRKGLAESEVLPVNRDDLQLSDEEEKLLDEIWDRIDFGDTPPSPLPEDDTTTKAALPVDDSRPQATPPEALDYWRHYDELMQEIGYDWLRVYMERALEALKPHLATLRPGQDIQFALDAAHPEFIAALLGTDDEPGPLVKLIMAGMAAGQEAIAHGRAANPRRPVAAKALSVNIDWHLLATEARDFVRHYLFDLIRNVDDTTRKLVSDAVTKWLESGESLDTLSKEIDAIFRDPARAQVISSTEATRAYAAGSKMRYQQANVQKAIWNTVNDSVVCPICRLFKGTIGTLDGGWSTKDGPVFPPAHPGCRCWMKPVVEEE
jgi:SPP1 gp7 family putative phage head morphogenesis protein